jgi:hypothetical protein
VKHVRLFQDNVFNSATFSKMAIHYAYWHYVNTMHLTVYSLVFKALERNCSRQAYLARVRASLKAISQFNALLSSSYPFKDFFLNHEQRQVTQAIL